MEKAEEDLDTAMFNFSGRRYKASAFFCQQAAEKALKALLLKRGKGLIKTHDLVVLARKSNAPKVILEHAKELTLAYTYARYPDVPEIKNIKRKAKIFLDYAQSVIEWTKKSLRD